MSAKNTTAANRGAMLAKESLVIRMTPPITVEKLEVGNRAMRRVTAKQRKKGSAK